MTASARTVIKVLSGLTYKRGERVSSPFASFVWLLKQKNIRPQAKVIKDLQSE